MSSPTETHWQTLIRIVKYLKNAVGKGIVYQNHGHVKVDALFIQIVQDLLWTGSLYHKILCIFGR